MRVLALVTDAFGGHGGIAQYNRDLLTALCDYPDCTEVLALPRLMDRHRTPLPAKLTYSLKGLGGRLPYLMALLRILFQRQRVDLVMCCHINLLPLAWLAAKLKSAPLVLTIFGIDAWQATGNRLANQLAKRVDGCIAISRYTRRLFLRWAHLDEKRIWVLPNAIHLENYRISKKNPALLRKHRLEEHKVLMTFGRLVSAERYKGFDEVLEALPRMIAADPSLVYMIVGDGDDRKRLEAKTRALGIADQVRFTGLIAEGDKAEYYALADVYVMPSRGEGFGFVFLEAMACGVPTIASRVDGSCDAAADGELAAMVNPADTKELIDATFAALQLPKKVPQNLSRYEFKNFSAHSHRIIHKVLAGQLS